VKHSNLTTATASVAAKQTAQDQALATEWGNAWREITEAADQQTAKYTVGDQQVIYDTTFWGRWTFLPVMDCPLAAGTSGTTVWCGREGRTINVKSVDHMCYFQCVQDATKANRTVVIRVVWFVNKVQSQSDTAPTSGQVFNGFGNVNEHNEGIIYKYNLDNQENYQIISDEVKTFTNRTLEGYTGHFTDHLDLDLMQTWNDQNTDGQDDKSVTNSIWCAIFPTFCDNLPTSTVNPGPANGGPGTGTFTMDRVVRMTYVDA